MDKESIKAMMMVMYEVIGSKEFADNIAGMMWNIYTACKEKGFDEDQAMRITLASSQAIGKTN